MRTFACFLAFACTIQALPSMSKRQVPGFFGTQGVPPTPQIAAAQQQQLALARLNAVQVSDNVYRVQPLDQSAAYSSALIVLMPRGQSINNVAGSIAQLGQGIPGLMSANANAAQSQPASQTAPLAAQPPPAAQTPVAAVSASPGLPNVPGTQNPGFSALKPSAPVSSPVTTAPAASTSNPSGAPWSTDSTAPSPSVSPWASSNLTSATQPIVPVINGQNSTTTQPTIVGIANSNVTAASPKLIGRSEIPGTYGSLPHSHIDPSTDVESPNRSEEQLDTAEPGVKQQELETVASGQARGSKQIHDALADATRSIDMD